MNNLNPYDTDQCQTYCKQLSCYHNLERDFDQLRWDKLWRDPEPWPVAVNTSPRELWGKKHEFPTVGNFPTSTVFSMVPFFYLRKLLEKNPDTIYDLGAGWNIFKKYIPNIIGISPTHDYDNYGDLHDLVDGVFVRNHQEYFESVFSINALHFRPLEEIEAVIKDFSSMVAVGGRGFLTLNVAQMITRASNLFLVTEFGTPSPTAEHFEAYTRKILSRIELNYLIVDVDFTLTDEIIPSDKMDGNIRIVFEK